MSRYIQIGKVEKYDHEEVPHLDYEYMGAAEFEFGSVQLTRQLLRFGKARARILDEVYYKPFDQGAITGVDRLVMIALDFNTPHGQAFDRAIADFHSCVRKSYDPKARFDFKERTRLEYSVGILGSAEYQPRETCFKRDIQNFWIGVDFGVRSHLRRSVFDESTAAENLAVYERYLQDIDRTPVWVVCRLRDFKTVKTGMRFDDLPPVGAEPIDPNSIRMFDTVVYRDPTGERQAKVVGILERGIRLERDGKRFNVSENSIVRIVKDKERARCPLFFFRR